MIEKAPPTETTTKPAPSHSGQTCGLVPGLPPVPLQSGQAESEVSRSEMVTPSMASVKLIVAEVSTSAPLLRPRLRPAATGEPPPKRSPNMSPKPPPAAGAVAEQVVDVEAAAPRHRHRSRRGSRPLA